MAEDEKEALSPGRRADGPAGMSRVPERMAGAPLPLILLLLCLWGTFRISYRFI